MKWMVMPLVRYADFSGRSRRLEYWMFTLFMLLVMIGFFFVFGLAGASLGESEGSSVAGGMLIVIGAICVIGIIIPSLAVQVRRLHDQDLSGWWILLGFIPYIGGLIMLVLMLIPGTKGSNRFGSDPKDPDRTDLAEVFS